MKNQIHVVYNGDAWGYKPNGATRMSRLYSTKQDAVADARRVSKSRGAELIIHKINGIIQNCDSHGKDPCPPHDTK